MANSFVLRGSTATLQFASRDSPAGLLGTKIFNDEYNIATVGRVTGVEIRINTELEVFHQIGTRQPIEVVPGNINISGSIDRAYMNGALMRMLLGRVAGSGENEDDIPLELQPNFNLVLTMHDPREDNATKGTRITVSAVRFDDWTFTLPEDDFVMENISFKALSIVREEVA